MSDMFAYLDGFGNSGVRDLTKSVVVVTAPEGQTVQIANSGGYGNALPVITKNLLDIDAYKAKVGTNAMRGSVTWFDDGLWLQATGDDCYTRYGSDYFNIPAKPNTKYTISWDVTGSANKEGYVYAFAYGSDGSQLNTFNAINTTEKLTFTTPEGTAKLGFRFGVQTAGENAFYTNIQIEEGEKTDYARYNSCMFEDVPNGWTNVSIDSGNSSEAIWISRVDVYYVRLELRITPEFTYTGEYEIVDDNDSPISDFASWKGHWKIRFLTSGVFTVVNKYGWNGILDAFLVGGGGGGGWGYSGGAGGGYTKTQKGIPIEVGVPYQITIGAGGAPEKNGGSTSAFSVVANGGTAAGYADSDGAPGGSGGGAGYGGIGGSDGSSGMSSSCCTGGVGQGSTTREFGEPNGKLYAGGGGGGGSSSSAGGEGGGAPGGQSAEDNTGGGAGGALQSSHPNYNERGGSGIVIIRDSRAA